MRTATLALAVLAFLSIAGCVNRPASTPDSTPHAEYRPEEDIPSQEVPTWPTPGKDLADPIQVATGELPSFPETVPGYELTKETRDVISSWDLSEDWKVVYPSYTRMETDDCLEERYYVRWQVVTPGAIVEAAHLKNSDYLDQDETPLNEPVAGSAGLMSNYGCVEPAFRELSPIDYGSTYSTDIAVEIQQWKRV